MTGQSASDTAAPYSRLRLGGTVEKKSLMRRYLGAELLEEAAETRQEGRMRPAQLYRLKDRKTIHYFVRTMEGPRAGEE